MKALPLLLILVLCVNFDAVSQKTKHVDTVLNSINKYDSLKTYILSIIDSSFKSDDSIYRVSYPIALMYKKNYQNSFNQIDGGELYAAHFVSFTNYNMDKKIQNAVKKEILKFSSSQDFGNTQELGKTSALETAVYLDYIGDTEEAVKILNATGGDYAMKLSQISDEHLPKWAGTTHSLGFVNPVNNNFSIIDATKVQPNGKLKHSAIKICLDLLYVDDYPGKGKHNVLIEFSGKNQINDDTKEQVNYALTKSVTEGQFAGLRSIPIVVGLRVGKEGVEFKCTTTNVKNENDERLMSILNSETTSEGLKLLTTVNPVIPIVSNLISGIGKQIITRNENRLVQVFNVGLDFSTSPMRAKLAEGSYIVAQTGNEPFSWADWELSKDDGRIVSKMDKNLKLPYNYLVFSISKVE